jgi:PKD repeat protein
MRKIFLVAIILYCNLISVAQESTLHLKSVVISDLSDMPLTLNNTINYCFLVFNEIPTLEVQLEISRLGIEFLDYIPSKAYVVSVPKNCIISELEKLGVITLFNIQAVHKIDPKIQNSTFPDWAISIDKLSIKALLYKNANLSSILELFSSKGYQIDEINNTTNSITLSIPPSDLMLLAATNSVFYIEPIDPPSIKENKTGRTLHRSNTINTTYANGRHYNGEGINIMMQDDGIIGPHIDYIGRVDQSNCSGCSTSNSNDHGDHVAGTIMGAGNLDPKGAGMSNAAFLYVYSSSNNNYYDLPTLYQNNDVIITSKSYSNGCNAGYTSLAMDLDEQINLYPSLIHVFSAGNNGSSDCSYGAGSGWGNVTGGHKQAKNVIAVANLTSTGGLASSSSRGPAADGRIKPDIGAKGTDVYSTVPTYNYDNFSGTSMACPGIAGVLGQLYQAYKELNGGQNPSSALMKGLLLNTADDIGNPGPDFMHGWGEVNAFKAVKLLEDGNYINSSISQGGNNSHLISVPSGVKQLKVMVYWHDKEASVSAATSLVNDIDIKLFNNSGVLLQQPWLLDATPTAAALNTNATRGSDHLNNMEQITYDNPPAGNYLLDVDGFSIPFGPQEYWVIFQYITDDLFLTYPIGGEGFVPGETEILRWDASFGNTPFTLQYTTDNGVNWNTITTSASVGARYYSWAVPSTVSNQAKIRVSRGGFSDESDANFTIVGVPQNVLIDWICPDSIYVSWSAVTGATHYETSMLGNMYMDSMATTTSTTALIINPNPANIDSWFSVCAKVNGNRGRREVAINAQPTNSGCIAQPLADFSLLNPLSCSGIINFTDESNYQPNTWQWEFGDGNTSNQQHPNHTYQNEGTYDVSLFVANSLGQDSILQIGVVTVSFMPAPITYNDTAYSSPAIFSLTSASSGAISWYSDTLGSMSIASGSPFITSSLSATTTYYVREFGGPTVFGGALDSAIGNGAFYSGNRYMIFDAFVECKLVSAIIYANTSSTITFELRSNLGNVLDDTTIAIAIGQQTIYFDFDIPIGTDLQLGVNGSVSGIYRNNNGASYPYPIGTLMSITGASNTSTQNNWYFYYNLEIQENCISDFAEATAVFMLPSYIEDISSIITIYPNPTQGTIFVSAKDRIKEIYLYDISGRLCLTQSASNPSIEIDCKILSKGMYIIKIITEKHTSSQHLIIN